jgi:gliding motility-associated-like protein
MKKLWFFLLLILLSFGAFAQPCPVSVTITGAPAAPVCKGTSVVLTASPSVGALTPIYYWIIGNDTTLGVGSTFSVLAYDQSVTVLMSTTTGCTPDSDSAIAIPVQIQTVLIEEIANQLNYDCTLNVGDIQFTQTGGTDPTNYNLEGFPANITGSFTAVPAGSYNLYLTDDDGCRDTGQVVVAPLITITSIASPDIVCNQTTADVFTNTSPTISSTSYTYELVGIETNETGVFTSVPAGNYTLYTTDNNGCKDTSELVIILTVCEDPYPTSAITPNDDGFNDTWKIQHIEFYPEAEVYIFDRWGQRVYHKKGYDNLDGWGAKYLGVGLPVSTYYYVLKVPIEDGDDLVFKGPISVFR